MPQTHRSIIALDVGSVRVGVAVVSLIARLPRPLTTLDHDDSFFEALSKVLLDEDAGAIVVGLPRGMQGQTTAQTEATESFVTELKQHFSLPIFLQDEAVTSHNAEAELEARGRGYSKGDVDALAATYILDDYLKDHPNINDSAEY